MNLRFRNLANGQKGFTLIELISTLVIISVLASVLIPQEGRGIGLANKLRAYELQDNERKDTVEANLMLGFQADHRDYGVGAQILYELGVRRLRLMTNHPGKFVALKGYGLEIVERVPLELPPNRDSLEYLRTKKFKLGHLLESV